MDFRVQIEPRVCTSAKSFHPRIICIEAVCKYRVVVSTSPNFVVLMVCVEVIGTAADVVSASTSIRGMLMLTGVGQRRSLQYASLSFIEAIICAAHELPRGADRLSSHLSPKSIELASE